jgi:monoamine oxidase
VHDHCGADGRPAALLGFSASAPTRAAVIAQLVRLFGDAAASPLELTMLDWSAERFTAVPPGAPPQRLAMGSRIFSAPGAMGGRLQWTSTETAQAHAGHIEGALEAAERTAAAVLALRAAATR